MPDFFQNFNLSLQYLNFGYFGLSDGFYGVQFTRFSVSALSDNSIMSMTHLLGIYVKTINKPTTSCILSIPHFHGNMPCTTKTSKLKNSLHSHIGQSVGNHNAIVPSSIIASRMGRSTSSKGVTAIIGRRNFLSLVDAFHGHIFLNVFNACLETSIGLLGSSAIGTIRVVMICHSRNRLLIARAPSLLFA